jgi:choline-glycine betaine transporter
MLKNPLLLTALGMTAVVALLGVLDTAGLAAEPLTHYSLIAQQLPGGPAAGHAMVVTNFNWALHAWCIYAVTALVIAYYAYRKGRVFNLAFVAHYWLPQICVQRLDRWRA